MAIESIINGVLNGDTEGLDFNSTKNLITITLGQGAINIRDHKGGVWTVVSSSLPRLLIGFGGFDGTKVAQDTPIAHAYQWCQQLGYSSEQTIDTLLKIYHRFRFFKIAHLTKRELVLGFIGSRGSGKSMGASIVSLYDFMMVPGYQIFSNMPLACKIQYRDAQKIVVAKELSKLSLLKREDKYDRSLVVLDEVNMEIAESSRYMSKTNLEFSNFMQQIRKRGCDCIWTGQVWHTIDPRLRYQTDFAIDCDDDYLQHPGGNPGLGHYSNWRIYDNSGISGEISSDVREKKHYLNELEINRARIWTRPFWGIYDSFKKQGQGSYAMKDLERQGKTYGELSELGVKDPLGALINTLVEHFTNHPEDKIVCDDVWRGGSIKDHADRVRVGQALAARGIKRRQGGKGYYWQVVQN